MDYHPPPPQVLDRPGAIRWAVGSPEGPRSHTWSVVGHGRTDDVFVGIRDHMHVMKLSLHPAKWRMALTEQAAAQSLPEGVDRVITRWNQPDEVAQGWRHAACVIVTRSNLGYGYPEKRVKGGGAVSWFPAPEEPFVVRFDVMLGRPDAEQVTVENAALVGQMRMASGAGVWIFATGYASTPEYEKKMAELRSEVLSKVPEETPAVRGWAWGEIDDGVPQLVDLSGVASKPDGGGPGRPRPPEDGPGWFGVGKLR